MKLTIKLDEQEVRTALATWASQVLGITVNAEHVKRGVYSWETPTIEVDTDAEQELTSAAADAEIARLVA